MRNLFAFILLMATAAQGQTVLTAVHNQMRDADELTLRPVSMNSGMKEGTPFVIDLSEMEMGSERVTRTYSADIVPDTLTAIMLGTRSYYQERGDTTLLVGMENTQIRVVYDRPEAWLRFPLAEGDSLGGLYGGAGTYCDRLFLRRYGSYQTRADATGTIVLPNGDRLDGVLRVTTRRTSATIATPIDTLQREIPPFTADSITRHLGTDSVLQHEVVCRYYAPGYRYPVLETATMDTSHGGHTEAEHVLASAYYFAPEAQQQLALDEENMALRTALARQHEAGDSDGNSGQTARGRTGGLAYAATVDSDGSTLHLSYTADQELRFGYGVYSMLDGRAAYVQPEATIEAGTHQEDITLQGVRPGLYALAIFVNGERTEEKLAIGK